MKTLHKLILMITVLAYCNLPLIAQLENQPDVPLSMDYVTTNVTDISLKQTLFATTQKMLNGLNYHGDFFDPDTRKTDDIKISEFSDLFASESNIYNLVDVSNPQNISLSDFVNYLYTHFKDQELDFEILNAELVSLTDDGSFYTGQMRFEFKQYSGLDDRYRPKFISKGLIKDLTLNYRIFPYDTDIAEITSLSGAARQIVSIDKVSNFDIHLTGGIGFLSASIDPAYVDALGSLSTSATSFGIDAMYRTSFNESQTLYFAVGFGAQMLNLTTEMENFYSFENDNLAITHNATGRLTVDESKISGSLDPFSSAGSDNPRDFASGYIVSIDDGKETNRGIRLGVPLGVSYRLSKGLESRFFVDLVAIPSYILWNNSSMDGMVNFVKVPDENFPDRNDLINRIYTTNAAGRVDGAIDPLYTESYAIGGSEAKALAPAGTFDFDIRLSPTYKKLIGADWGISIGLDLQMNVLNLFSSSDYQGDFLEGDLNSFNLQRDNSIHQDLITSNKLFLTNFKIGYYKDL